MFWFFGWKACGILAPLPGIEPAPRALEGEVLTTGPPGKSLYGLVLIIQFYPPLFSSKKSKLLKTNEHTVVPYY